MQEMTEKDRLQMLVDRWETLVRQEQGGVDIVDIGYTIEYLKRLQELENVVERCSAVICHIEAFEKLSDPTWNILDMLFKLPALKALEHKHRLKRFEDLTEPDPSE